MKKIDIYTDGACSGNPGVGGWGALLTYNNGDKKIEKKINGAEKESTNNRMELMAPIEALKIIKISEVEINIYTDSVYVKDGITKWIINWKKNNWKTANKKPVKNQDLWQQLDQLNNEYKVIWHWVKGHNGNIGNEIADELARNAIKSI